MSKSAAVALEANFKLWREKRFPKPKPTYPNYFNCFCIIQFLKSFVIGDREIKIGHVDAKGGKHHEEANVVVCSGSLRRAVCLADR